MGVHCLPELAALITAQSGGTSSEKRRMARLYRALCSSGLTKQDVAKGFRVCSSLPVINLRWSMETDVYGADDEATISVTIQRQNRSHQVVAPKFPKPKTEGHWLVLGCEAQGELLAVKRVTIAKTSKTSLTFYTDDIDMSLGEDGRADLSLYLISDSYIGLDQQYTIPIYINGDEEELPEDSYDEEPADEYGAEYDGGGAAHDE